MSTPETSPVESANSSISSESEARPSAWVKVGFVAAASALAGGLAAAWFYRKTLNRFRQAESDSENSDFGRADPDAEGDA
jgi:membrane associated rhomboid family serine protease